MADRSSLASHVDALGQTVSSMPPTLELLSYYRQRIEEFEAERAEFLKRFKSVEETGEEVHALRAEVKVREQEVAELQKALSDANVFLYEEREQILKLQAENDSLKIQEIEDRRRIQHLLALTQPVAQEVTFFRDCRPEKMTRFPTAPESLVSPAGGSAAHRSERMDKSKSSSVDISTQSAHSPSPASDPSLHTGNRVLRTVYLPSERADALLLTTQSLQQQVDDMRKLMDERAEAWRKDRQDREQTHKRREDADAARVAALEKDLEKTKDKLKAVTQDYLTLRHESQAGHRQIKETAAALQAANTKLAQEMERTRALKEHEVDQVKTAARREGLHFKEYTRQQAQQREDDLRLLKEQYAEVQRLYETRVKAVEAKYDSLKQKYTALQRRRNLELEGFTNDITLLRRTIMQFESQWAVLSESIAMHTSASTSLGESQSPQQSRGAHVKARDADSSILKWRVRSSGYGDSSGSTDRRSRTSKSSERRRRRTPAMSKDDAYVTGAKVAWPPAHHTHAAAVDEVPVDSASDSEGPSSKSGAHTSAVTPRHAVLSKSTSRETSSFQNSITEKLQAELDRAVADMSTLRAKMARALGTE